MSVEPRQALYVHLRGDPGVQAAVGDRLYQRRVPAGLTSRWFDPAAN